MPKRKKVVIREVKLGREGNFGQYWFGKRIVDIDPRLKPKKYLEILIHELLHDQFPTASENKIKKAGKVISAGVWKMRYRRLMK